MGFMTFLLDNFDGMEPRDAIALDFERSFANDWPALRYEPVVTLTLTDAYRLNANVLRKGSARGTREMRLEGKWPGEAPVRCASRHTGGARRRVGRQLLGALNGE